MNINHCGFLILLQVFAATLPSGAQHVPEFYYGWNGMPTELPIASDKIAIESDVPVTDAEIHFALIGELITGPTASQLPVDALVAHGQMLIRPDVAINHVNIRTLEARIQAKSPHLRVKPVFRIHNRYEEVETGYVYASFPLSMADAQVRRVLAKHPVNIVKRIQYEGIGVAGYRLRVRNGSAGDSIAIANQLHRETEIIAAAPVFAHNYDVLASIYPSDRYFVEDSTPHQGIYPLGDPQGDGRQWYLYNTDNNGRGHINMPDAWDAVYSLGTPPTLNEGMHDGVVVAVLDNGVMATYTDGVTTCPTQQCDCPSGEGCVLGVGHPDLDGQMWRNTGESATFNGQDDDDNGYADDLFGWDFVDNDRYPYPNQIASGPYSTGHGTGAATVIAAKGNQSGINSGIAGICWSCKIMPLRVENYAQSVYSGGDQQYDMKAADGILYAANNGADVLALHIFVATYNPEIHDALKSARQKGCVIAVPASNANNNLDEVPLFPQVLPEVVNVGAVTFADTRCTPRDWGLISRCSDTFYGGLQGANYGSSLDICAPSSTKLATDNYGIWKGQCPLDVGSYWGGGGGGTSSSYPQVVGAAALLKTVDVKLSPADIQSILQSTAYDIVGSLASANIALSTNPVPCEYDPNSCPDGCAIEGDEFDLPSESYCEGRDIYTGYGLIDVSAAVESAMSSRFAITRKLAVAGETRTLNALTIDTHGNMVIDGNLVYGQLALQHLVDTEASEFIIYSSDEEMVAKFDPTWDGSNVPTLYLAGTFAQNQGTLMPPANSFIVQHMMSGNPVVDAYIDSSGNMKIRGSLFLGSDPDPDVTPIELIHEDDFEDGNYTSNPTWNVAEGAWTVSGTTDKYLYSGTDADNTIRLAQTISDIRIDLRVVPANSEFDIYVRQRLNTPSSSVYIKLDPPNSRVLVFTSVSGTPLAEATGVTLTTGTEYQFLTTIREDTITVWYRERIDEALFAELIQLTDSDLELAGTNEYFTLRDLGQNSRWKIDDIIISTATAP